MAKLERFKTGVKGGIWVRDPDTGELVPKGETQAERTHMIQSSMEAFKSPIDGQVISTRAQLRDHNKKHGVTHTSDYSKGYIENKARERVNAGEKYLKETRRTDIGAAIDRHR